METKKMISFLRTDDGNAFMLTTETAREIADRLEDLKQANEQLKALLDSYKVAVEHIPEKQPKWISVEDERKPNDSRNEYLACNSKNGRVYILPADGEVVPWSTFGITHWMPLLEPPKQKEPTFKDKFLEAFPKATTNDKGDPKACRALIFGEGRCHHNKCSECWNQPYFEEEE